MSSTDVPEIDYPWRQLPLKGRARWRGLLLKYWKFVVVGAVIVVAIIAVVMHFAGARMKVRGSMTVGFVDIRDDGTLGDACIDGSENGYGDISGGAQVEVTDDEGATVGLGTLGPGKKGTSFLAQTCTYNFSVSGVPTGKPFYGVRIGNEGRGSLKFTSSEIGQPLRLKLGEVMDADL